MHRISHVEIKNFRACLSVSLPLDDFTPLVGQNNVGKSTILDALKWLLKPDARSSGDFADPKQPIVVTARIEGISAAILSCIPEPKHQTAIQQYCPNGVLWIRVTADGTTAKSIKPEVWDPAAVEVDGNPKEWRAYPTGLPQAVSAILPEPLFIQAMKDVQKEFTSVAAGTTIRRLIEEIAEPVTQANATDIEAALKTINSLLTGEGGTRSKALQDFDEEASKVLAEFFPGLALQLELPETKIKEFFKSGSLKVSEVGRPTPMEFSQLGSGAQRAIEMSLIRYLAEAAAGPQTNGARKLLLIDEPELYLHPQGVRRVRQALAQLSTRGFQVVFSTHSPLMLDRVNAAHTVIVRKDAIKGAVTRKPLKQAIQDALEEAKSQSRVLFELGNIADIYFAERVVICEGKTDRRILPLVYERLYGHAPEIDHLAFVSIGSCADIRKALSVLRAMEIPACAVADLDFAFTEAAKGSNPLIAKDGAELVRAKAILKRLQPAHGFSLGGNGLPEKNGSFSAADIWALLAIDNEGEGLASTVHGTIKQHSVWIWEKGCIEHVIGTVDKGEEAIIEREEALRVMSRNDVSSQMPDMVECFEWIKSFEK
ncbi:MAG: ATP-dependent endonuclease [Holophagaceae bacterium]|nr:ATP-dependent endonuclease [Holophagaceae bacterium]